MTPATETPAARLVRMLGLPKAQAAELADSLAPAELAALEALEGDAPAGKTHGDLLAEILDARADRLKTPPTTTEEG